MAVRVSIKLLIERNGRIYTIKQYPFYQIMSKCEEFG